MRSLVYGLVCTIGGAICADATELKPTQAQTIDFGMVQGIAYYTVEQDGMRVVTTLMAGEAALRIVSILKRDQNVVISVPGSEGSDETRIVIERKGKRVYFNGPAMAMN